MSAPLIQLRVLDACDQLALTRPHEERTRIARELLRDTCELAEGFEGPEADALRRAMRASLAALEWRS